MTIFANKTAAAKALEEIGIAKGDTKNFIKPGIEPKTFIIDLDAAKESLNIGGFNEMDAGLLQDYGHVNCPGCGDHLADAGVREFSALSDGLGGDAEAYKQQKLEFACMKCEHEWGEDQKPKGKAPSNSDRATPVRLETSTAEKPTKLVWKIADENPGMLRADVIKLCLAAGIAPNTAKTQYWHWNKAQKEKALVAVPAPAAEIEAEA